jgi:uncharacterized protein YjbJ (UPF0337 family)
MKTTSKISILAQRAKGRAQEAAGRTTGNTRLKARGKGTRLKSDLRRMGERVKDVAKH